MSVSATQKGASKKSAFSTLKDAYDTSERVVKSTRRHGGTFQMTTILTRENSTKLQIPKHRICVVIKQWILIASPQYKKKTEKILVNKPSNIALTTQPMCIII
jgi:hypothetical protein